MTQITLKQVEERTDADWRHVIRLGGIVSWIQLGMILSTVVVGLAVGLLPETAEGYFQMLNNEGVIGVLRLDLGTLLLLALMPFLAVAIYGAFRPSRPAYGFLALVLVLLGILLSLANESALSMMHLADLYAAAGSAAQQAQIVAAGEAVLAADMWHSTAGFLSGVFMQGGFVFISAVMLGSKAFSKWTAYTGLLSNGLDFLHLFVGLVAPALGSVMLGVGGVFYLFWFVLLGRDLVQFGRR
jgi:hypothetical protein